MNLNNVLKNKSVTIKRLMVSDLIKWFSSVSSVQSLSSVQLFVTPWTAARQASLSITNSQSFTQTHFHGVSDAIQPSHPLSSPSPPTFNLSQHQGLFKCVCTSHEVVKVLEFQLQLKYSLEGLMLKLKLQYFGHLMQRADTCEKTLMLGKIEGRRRRGWQRMR